MKRILLVSFLVLALTVVSVGCAKSDEAKIKDTVNGLYKALNDKDYEKAADYFTSEDVDKDTIAAALEAWAEAFFGDSKITVKSIDDVVVDDETATASVVISVDGDEQDPEEVEFEKVDGSWKIPFE